MSQADENSTADILQLHPRKVDLTNAERQRRYRARHRKQRKKGVTQSVTQGVTAPVTRPVSKAASRAVTVALSGLGSTAAPTVTVLPPPRRWTLPSVVLGLAAFGLAGVGVAINGWFAHSLGSTELAGQLFLAIGISADIAAFVLPCCASAQWAHRRYAAALAGWVAWALTFLFALIAGIGFASLNIADVTLARAGRDTPAVVAARAALDDAKHARDRECGKVGPVCRQREDAVLDRQRQLDVAMRATATTADPQTDGAVKLAAWVTLGWLRPTGDDFATLRLLLLALLPQLGGVLLMVSRSR